MFFIADCEKHITFSYTRTQNKHYPIPLPLQKQCYLLVPTRGQNDAQLKEFVSLSVDSCHQKCDDSGCTVQSGTTDALHVYPEIKALLIKIAAPGEAGAAPGQEEEFADSMGTPIRSAAVRFSSSRMRKGLACSSQLQCTK